MRKIISAILSSALAVSAVGIAPLHSEAAGSQYEFEDGMITSTGENSAKIGTRTAATQERSK